MIPRHRALGIWRVWRSKTGEVRIGVLPTGLSSHGTPHRLVTVAIARGGTSWEVCYPQLWDYLHALISPDVPESWATHPAMVTGRSLTGLQIHAPLRLL